MNYQEYQHNFDRIVEKTKLLHLEDVYMQETGYTLQNKQGPCIFCNSGHNAHAGSDGAFSIQISTNIGHCFSCGASAGIVKLIMHHNNLNYIEAIHYIALNYFQEKLENPNKKINVTAKKRTARKWEKPSSAEISAEKEKRKKTFEYIKNLVLTNPQKKEAVKYLENRCIRTDTLPKASFFQGNSYNNLPAGVVFFDSEKKLLNKRYISNKLPKGIAKAFNYGELHNSVYNSTFRKNFEKVFVTEGVINALSLYCIGKSAIAIFGTTNTLSDVEKFRQYFEKKDIIIALDFDIAGQRTAVKIALFILENYQISSLKILLFPVFNEKSLDANDLLQKKQLKIHIENELNYIKPTKKELQEELEKIKKDYQNYFPNKEYSGYTYSLKSEEEKNDTFRFFKIQKNTIQQEKAKKLKLNPNILIDLNIKFLESYWYIKNNIKHSFIASENNPILLLETKESKIIWRPNTKYPFNEIEYLKKPEKDIVGKAILENAVEEAREALQFQIGETIDKTKRKKLQKKKPIQSLFITLNIEDYIKIKSLNKEAILFLGKKLDYNYYKEKLKPNFSKIYLLPNNSAQQRMLARAIGLSFIDIYIFNVEKEFKSIADYLNFLETNDYVFFKKLNTALPFRFWEYENNEVKLNLIAFLNFIQTKGYFTYEDQKDKKGYQYIFLNGKVVESFADKELFVRHIRNYANEWLRKRGEQIKIRNKILTSGEFTERNMSQLKEVSLDFENSGKHFQNFFFSDGNMWFIANNRIECYKQSRVKKFIWKDEIIDFPSKIKEAPFTIQYTKEYQKKINKKNSIKKGTPEYLIIQKELRNFPEIYRYEIFIHDKNNYFLQYLWLTSYIYWNKAEKKGYEIKPNDFWFEIEKKNILTYEEISEMKLHLINNLKPDSVILNYLIIKYLLYLVFHPNR